MPTLELDGRSVTYDEAGPAAAGAGAPLLLLHGFTGGRDDFAAVLEPLAEERRVVAVDLPGHGGSGGPDEPASYGLAAVAAWVIRCADALGLGPHHLLGHSLGGLVAQHVAAVESQSLVSLVLLDTGLGALREAEADRIVRIAVAARDEGPEAAFAASLEGRAALPHGAREAKRARFHGLNPHAVVGGARNLVTAVPLGAFLRGIDVPVLVIHGERDEVWTPGEQQLLAATVAGAEHVVVPDAGHTPQQENPESFVALVRAFLRQAER